MKNLLLILSIISVFNTVDSYSQNNTKQINTLSVDLNIAPTLFYGELKQNDWLPSFSSKSELGMSYGLSINKTFNYALGGRFQFNTGSIKGMYYDSKLVESDINNVYFINNYNELGFFAIVNFSNMIFPKSYSEKKYYFYGLVGFGLSSFRTIKRNIDSDVIIRSFGYDNSGSKTKNKTTENTFPMGFGMKYKVNDKIDLGFEISLRNPKSDKLDASTYELNGKDNYQLNSFIITYKIGKNKDDFNWSNPYADIVKTNELLKQKIMLLSRDSDYDGVVDYFDKEPETPEGAPVDYTGKALDTDEDGIADYKDMEIHSPFNSKVDTSGVIVDSDNDGIDDNNDVENSTPKGAVVNFKGQSIQSSSNTINNYVGETKTGGAVSIFPSVFFDINSDNITEIRNIEKLASIAQVMRYYPELKIKVIGYSDKIGGANQYNLNLSEQRAKSVIKHLSEKYLIDKSRFVFEGRGSTDYLSKENNYLNRRVDFEITK